MSLEVDISGWNFSHKAMRIGDGPVSDAVITGNAILLGDAPCRQARVMSACLSGAGDLQVPGNGLVFLMQRRPGVLDIVSFPRGNHLLVSEEGSRESGEFLAAQHCGVFYANNARGAIGFFVRNNLIAKDLRDGLLSAPNTALDVKTGQIRMKARALSTTDDLGNGMSSRQDFFFDVANQLFAAGAWDQAEDYFVKADDIRPDNPLVSNNRGGNFYRWGRLDDAEDFYRRALRQDPGHRRARKNLGDVLLDKGAWTAALEQYDLALQINRQYAGAHHGRGNALLSLERYEEAETAFRVATDLDPAHLRSFINLGGLLVLRGRESKARQAYQDALALDPDNPDLRECVESLRE